MFTPEVKAGWEMWGVVHTICPSFIPSPGGESHFPWVEVTAERGLGLIQEQKAQWEETTASQARHGLRLLDQQPLLSLHSSAQVMEEHEPVQQRSQPYLQQ